MALPSFSPTQDESLSADGGYLSSLVKPNPAFQPQEQQFGAANLGADQGVLPSTQMATAAPQSLPSQPLAQGALQAALPQQGPAYGSPEWFKNYIYEGGADDAMATQRGLDYITQQGMRPQDAANLWNASLGTDFSAEDYYDVTGTPLPGSPGAVPAGQMPNLSYFGREGGWNLASGAYVDPTRGRVYEPPSGVVFQRGNDVVVGDELFWSPYAPTGDKLKTLVQENQSKGYRVGTVVSPYATLVGSEEGKGDPASIKKLAREVANSGVDFVAIDPYVGWFGLKSEDLVNWSRDFLREMQALGKDTILVMQNDVPGTNTRDEVIAHNRALMSIPGFSEYVAYSESPDESQRISGSFDEAYQKRSGPANDAGAAATDRARATDRSVRTPQPRFTPEIEVATGGAIGYLRDEEESKDQFGSDFSVNPFQRNTFGNAAVSDVSGSAAQRPSIGQVTDAQARAGESGALAAPPPGAVAPGALPSAGAPAASAATQGATVAGRPQIDTSNPATLITNILSADPNAAQRLIASRTQAFDLGEGSSFNDPGEDFGGFTVRATPNTYDFEGKASGTGFVASRTENAPDTEQLRQLGLAGRPVETTLTYDASGNLTGSQKRFFKGSDSGIVYQIDPQGKVIGASEFDYSESWKGVMTPLVQMATMALFPYLGTIGGALSGGALTGAAASGLGGAVVGGTGAALTGQDVLKGAALGGLGAAGGQLAQGLGQAASTALGGGVLGNIAAGVIRGAAGALPAAIASEDINKLVTGALSGGVGAGTQIALSELGIPLSGTQIAQGMSFLKAVQNDDVMGAVNAALQLEGSQNSKVASAALGVANAVRTGNPQAIISAMSGLSNALQKPVDPGEAAFLKAKQAGATDAEAADAARRVTGGDAIDQATARATGLPITQMAIPNIEIIDDAWGDLSGAMKAAAQRNTLNIGAAEANTPAEAASLAQSKGYGVFTFGGRTYSIGASADEILGQVQGTSLKIGNDEANTPEEAAALAKQRGASSFTFGGTKYDLNAQQEVRRLFNEYAQSKNKTIDQLSANEVNSFFDKVNPYIVNDSFTILKGASLQDVLSGNVSDKPMQITLDNGYYDDQGRYYVKIGGVGDGRAPEFVEAPDSAQGLLDWANSIEGTKGEAVRQALSTSFGMVGEQLADWGTSLANMKLADRYNALVKFGQKLEDIGQKLEIPGVTAATKNWVKGVEAETTYSGKLAAAIKGIYDNPLALVVGAKEIGQEVIPILTGLGVARFFGKAAGVATDVLMNAAESMGSQSRSTYNEEIAAGKSPKEAAAIADRKGWIAGGITAGFAGIADATMLKMYERVTDKVLGKGLSAAGREFRDESGEEFLISLATGDDLATAMTKSVLGGLVGAKASGTIQVTSDLKSDLASAFAAEGYTSSDGTFSPGSLVPMTGQAGAGANVAADTTSLTNVTSDGSSVNVTGDIVNATSPDGQTTNISVTNNDLTSGDLSNNVTTAVNNGSDAASVVSNVTNAAANTGADVNAATNAAVDAANNAGAQVTVTGDTVNSVQTNNDITTNTTVNNTTGATDSTSVNNTNGNVTNSTTDGSQSTVTTSDNTTGVNTEVTTDAATGVNTETTSDPNTNTTTVVATDSTTNTTSNTVTDANTNVTTNVVVDANTGVNTNTTTDANTNVTTQVVTDANTNVTTEVTTDANTNVTTQVVTDANTGVNTNTQTDSNTNITTQVVTDSNAGTNTETTSNADTGVTTQVTTDTNTNTTTQVTTDSNTNVTTQVVTDANTGVNTETQTDANTGVTTQIVTDTNTNTTTQTVTDTNTNITTQVTTDANTTTQTTTNTNTNVTTQITTDTNTGVTTQITTNANTGVTTMTATNGSVEVTTNINPDTNTQTTVVVNVDTGDILDFEQGEITQDIKLDPIKPVDPVKPVIALEPVTPVEPVSSVVKPTKPVVPPRPRVEDGGAMLLPAFGAVGARESLSPQFLKSFETQGYIDPLAKVKEVQAELQGQDLMQQVDPRLASILQQRMGQPQEQDPVGALAKMLSGESDAANTPYYAYGEEEPISAIMGDRGYAQGGYVAPLMAKEGGMTLPLMAKKGGLPREDFRHGKHVAGEGDGQSDDIPAWLADGEFVFPADVVSALGNGSTKAGTDKLYEMMHAIRARARSKGPKDLPPPALKSPLDYLKSKK